MLSGEKMEFHINNNFETKRSEGDFSLSSVFNIAVPDIPVTVNDIVLDFSKRSNELRFKWALDMENKLSLDSSFNVEASVNSFEITGEPLIEIRVDDSKWEECLGLSDLEVKLDFDAKNGTDAFEMKMNKLSVEVNRGQYDFKVSFCFKV